MHLPPSRICLKGEKLQQKKLETPKTTEITRLIATKKKTPKNEELAQVPGESVKVKKKRQRSSKEERRIEHDRKRLGGARLSARGGCTRKTIGKAEGPTQQKTERKKDFNKGRDQWNGGRPILGQKKGKGIPHETQSSIQEMELLRSKQVNS